MRPRARPIYPRSAPYERILSPDRPPVHLLGLFDRVALVNEPGSGVLTQLRLHAFTSRNPSVAHVRHAVAPDDRRRMCEPVLWPDRRPHLPHLFQPDNTMPQDVREVWFTGTHGDVGGGWPEEAAGLAKILLLWMIEETKVLGLDDITPTVNRLVRGRQDGQPHVAPDACVPVNESMTAGWKFFEYLPKPMRGKGVGAARCRQSPVPAEARNPEGLADLVARFGAQVVALALDVTERAACFAVAAQAPAALGRLEAVLNSAGYGLFDMTQAVLPVLRAQGAGHLVQISSVGGVVTFPGLGGYHASKWAVEGWSSSWHS